MSRSIVLKSFAELANVLDLDTLPDGPADIVTEETTPTPPAEPAADLAGLLAELEAASATLATVARQDQETRTLALRDLAQYDALVAEQCEAEQAHERARQVRQEAEALTADVFAVEARAAAERVAELAGKAESAAAALAEQRRREAERLAAQLDLERLLAARQRQEEAEKAKAAAAERAERLSGALTRAKAALEAGRLEEAQTVLGPVASENPDNADVTSLLKIIAQRARIVNSAAAEDALWAARRELRRDPAAAVARLEAVDVDDLPDPLTRQVFGTWAQACGRLCRERGLAEPLRYAPDPGRGAVLARGGPDAPYMVVSTLGMGAGWQPGSAVGERQVRRARPLR
jgi:hypothetical protein